MTKKWKDCFLDVGKCARVLRLMKFCMLLMMGVFMARGSVHAQDLMLNVKNATLKEVFKEIEEKSEYRFLFKSEDVLGVMGITFSVSMSDIDAVLALCLKGTKLVYERDGSLIVVKRSADDKKKEEKKEMRKIKGKVIDERSETLPGATVLLKGTTLGVVTDMDGKFSLEIPQLDTTILVVSFVGYETQEVMLKKDSKNDAKELEIRMKPEVTEMDEVVVTGYSQIRKESFTGNSISVSKDELLKVSKTNVIQALQVFDPSFRIQENNQWGSDPNALPEMYIRGRSGIGVKQLDANSLSKSNLEENPNLPLFIMDGFEITVQKLYDMDPNRIENITILKDAAATAMYGSRSANGVVVITTVVPKPGEVSVSFSLTGTLNMPDLTDYNLMNAAEKLETERLAGIYTYDPDSEWDNGSQFDMDKVYNAKLANVKRGVDTYWLSKPLRTVFNYKPSLYIEGGSKDLRFGLDLSYDNNNGVMKESARNRYGVGLSIDYRLGDFQIKNYISYNVTKSEESPYGSFSDYVKKLPYDEYKDEDGKYLEFTDKWGSSSTTGKENPLYEATLKSYDRDQTDELINNLAVNWYINNYWQIKGQFSVTKTMARGENFLDPESKKNAILLSKVNPISGELRTEEDNRFIWELTATAAYNQSIGKNHINLTFGINTRDDQRKSLSSFYKGFPNGSLSSINYANEIAEKPIVDQDKSRLFGMLASLNYTYDNVYLLDISLRMDGSSEFGADKRFAPFFSGGVGINIHNYEFMKNLGYIDMLKIRGSYGATGKVNFPAYAARTMYKIQDEKWYKTGIGASLIALGNAGLTWETTNTLDVGFDIQMLDGLVNVNASYYRKKTVDLINDVTIASSTGFMTYVDNVGEIMNKGFDVQLRSDVYKSKDWMVSIFANLSHNENELLKVSESLKAYNDEVQNQYEDYDQGFNLSDSKYSKQFTQYVEGGSTTSIWGMRSLGINPSDGEEVLVCRDGSTTYEWEASEQVALGDTEPKAQGSFGFNVRYKNWSLYTTFLYEFGGQRYNETLVTKVENANIEEENVDKRVLTQRWKQPGNHAKYKKLQVGKIQGATRPTERFVQDYNVLTCNSLTLGYDFGQHILKKIGFGVLRLELGANELFRVSSVKQERGLDYPYARTMNISLKASF